MMENKFIDSNTFVSATIAGDSIKLTTALGSKKPIVQRFDKDHMINIQTGDLIKIEHAKSRTDLKNLRSLRKTFEKIRMLINANFTGGKNQLFVTLTYKQSPMKDQEKLYKDFKAFMKRLRIEVNAQLAYILVVEPTAKGGWHCHTLIKRLDKKNFYIPNSKMAELWGKGFVNVRRIKQSDNIAMYLSAYLSDVDLNNLSDDVRCDKPKKIIKGARLSFYPSGMRIYRISRDGIIQPKKIKGYKAEIQEKYKIITPDYYRNFDLIRSDGVYTIEVEYYSRKKAKIKQSNIKENANKS